MRHYVSRPKEPDNLVDELPLLAPHLAQPQEADQAEGSAVAYIGGSRTLRSAVMVKATGPVDV